MNTCDQCAFYSEGPIPDRTNLGNCSCPKFVWGYDQKDDAKAMPDGVRVEDDEGWGFAVGPKFSCCHWQAAQKVETEDMTTVETLLGPLPLIEPPLYADCMVHGPMIVDGKPTDLCIIDHLTPLTVRCRMCLRANLR